MLAEKKDAASGQKLKVVATNSIIADITKNIAGDKIDLHSIVPVGQDPHEYEPLPEDVKKTSQADLIFYNGINLETGGNAWFTKLVENAKKTENKDYFAVSEGVDVIYLEGQNEKGKEDPHAWLNLENGMIFAKNIAKQLSAKDPSNKEFYEKNLKEYTDKLDKLDKEAKEKFNNIPAEKKLIVTSEDASNTSLKPTVSQVPISGKSTLKKKELLTKSRPWLKNFAKQKLLPSL